MISEIELKSTQIYGIRRNEVLQNYPSIFGLSDSALYSYTKQGGFLRAKQQRHSLYFFQGLNTNPQNLSIFLMSESTYFQQANPGTKQRITKGVFNVYDIYNKWDCVIEISIPGNLKIYKLVQGKKEIVSSEEIDLMYVSSVMRSLYQKNLVWGRYYEVFRDPKDNVTEFSNFLKIFFRVVLKHEIFIGEDFEAIAQIKGSHSLSLLFQFVRDKRLTAHCIAFLVNQMGKNPQLAKCPKVNIFLAQLYSQQGKYSKSIQRTTYLSKQYSNDPYILYYLAKYLSNLLMIDQAIQVLHFIVQYNQFQVWMLLSKLHIQNKNYIEALICLNNGAKLTKYRSPKPIEPYWKPFDEIGKARAVSCDDPMHYYVKLNIRSETPLSIPVKLVEEKLKPILEHPVWKLNHREKEIYHISEKIFYKLDVAKFQQLLKDVFEQEKTQVNQVAFKKGLTESMFIDINMTEHKPQPAGQLYSTQQSTKKKANSSTNLDQDLPHFLKQDPSIYQRSVANHDTRNLSIIPQLQSVIQNSNYQQKQPQQLKPRNPKSFNKRQMNQQYFKILKTVFNNDDYEKSIHESNYAKILPIYNKLRNATFINNYYYVQMYNIFVQTGNYNSIVVLLAEYLDFIETKGMRKIRKLPYWLENWIFHIIDEKGLVFLNNTLNKLNYIDQAVIEALENAKKWKIGGVTF